MPSVHEFTDLGGEPMTAVLLPVLKNTYPQQIQGSEIAWCCTNGFMTPRPSFQQSVLEDVLSYALWPA